jgi:hypothetical protein
VGFIRTPDFRYPFYHLPLQAASLINPLLNTACYKANNLDANVFAVVGAHALWLGETVGRQPRVYA